MPVVIKNGKKIKYDYTKKGKAAAKKMRRSIKSLKKQSKTLDYSLDFVKISVSLV